MTASPAISVVMPVHNARPFLNDSVASILNQTLADFEFVIFDDASTDGSLELLKDWAAGDKRIKLHEGKTRLGLSGSSNAVVSQARAPIIARMDADDIAHPERLQQQWDVIKDRPDVVAVGTLWIGIDANGREVRPRDRWRLLRRSSYIPFPHGSAMFRRDVFDRIGGYDEGTVRGEDQKLFSRMAACGRVLTLPEVLYSYRFHVSNATLFNGQLAVAESHSTNGDALAAFYMLGAMRLWAGESPRLLKPMLKTKSLKWTPKTLMIFASAVLGQVSPSALRAFLRTSIRARDLLASLQIKDGEAYDWRVD
ncbi:MAG TPA: glycosyltransferase family 2 protein [Pyrinomonadaceae bacterium]|nr:glycosyltransferase family 2 protein [Pyrinomonadaceae bacterium]